MIWFDNLLHSERFEARSSSAFAAGLGVVGIIAPSAVMFQDIGQLSGDLIVARAAVCSSIALAGFASLVNARRIHDKYFGLEQQRAREIASLEQEFTLPAFSKDTLERHPTLDQPTVDSGGRESQSPIEKARQALNLKWGAHTQSATFFESKAAVSKPRQNHFQPVGRFSSTSREAGQAFRVAHPVNANATAIKPVVPNSSTAINFGDFGL